MAVLPRLKNRSSTHAANILYCGKRVCKEEIRRGQQSCIMRHPSHERHINAEGLDEERYQPADSIVLANRVPPFLNEIRSCSRPRFALHPRRCLTRHRTPTS